MATSIRSATKARLTTLIAAEEILRIDGKPVQVTHGWPGELMQNECIWIGDVTGDVTVPSMKAGRKRRHDDFTIEIWVMVAVPDKSTSAAAEERCEVLMAAVEDVVADDPHLGGLGGLTGGVEVTEVEGPDGEPTDEGWSAIASIRVRCQSSLT